MRNPPASEPRSRRARVDLSGGFQVLLEVHQHVHERVANGTRGGECSGVISIVPKPTAAAEHAVHHPGETNGEAPNSSGEHVSVLCLDDEMNVVLLN
jgi:hypothetical protein